MAGPPVEDGLWVVIDSDGSDGSDGSDDDLSVDSDAPGDAELETLRDAFIDAFNSRDLDALLEVVTLDVECPDYDGEGSQALAAELTAIWERSPAATLTRAYLDAQPCAVGWLPDGNGSWSRAALLCFQRTEALLGVVAMPDATDDLERAEAELPPGDELDD